MHSKNTNEIFKYSIEDINKLGKLEKISILEKIIHYHNIKYFIENSPEISDEEFDRLTILLEQLKPNSPFLFEIVGDIGTIKHSRRMLSIEKKYSFEDIKKWVLDIDDDLFLVEPKYDGMAARYERGILATRGDGYSGENISKRLKDLKIIGKLDNKNSVDGEIIIPADFFDKYLAKDYKNSRNAVVGIIKAKNISDSGIKALMSKGIHFVIYDESLSIKVKKADLLDEDKWEEILNKIYNSKYPLDGVVIKATNLKLREKLGSTEHHYKWQIAFKLPAQKKWSEILEIKDQVGRTGRITSVAVIKPIELSGATVTNITLHNIDFVEKTRIGIGSKVEVMRAGEVIPFILNVIPAKFPHKPRIKCPVCQKRLKRTEKYLECVNIDCPARKMQSIEYFFKVLGVEELGLKTIERFVNEFKLKSVVDFYKLDNNKIAQLEGFGEKSANKIIDNIKATLNKTITPSVLLQALGIKEIGPAGSKWIINHYDFKTLNNLKADDLKNVKGIGPKKAENFVKELKADWYIVESLYKLGLKFKEEQTSYKLKDISFCITGKKENYSRDDIIKIIELNGGVYHTSVTKDLDYLIAGEDAGSKLEKAKKLGIKVIDEKTFFTLIK